MKVYVSLPPPPPHSADNVRFASGRPSHDRLGRVGRLGRSLDSRLLPARDCLLGMQDQKPQKRLAYG